MAINFDAAKKRKKTDENVSSSNSGINFGNAKVGSARNIREEQYNKFLESKYYLMQVF